MDCVTGKIRYASKSLAEEALIEKRARFHFRENSGPIGVYLCDDCGDWHFTSKGTPSSILNSDGVKNRIEKEREAYFWERKLRR